MKNRKLLELILGCVLLIPPLISVLLFFAQFFDSDFLMVFIRSSWTGFFSTSGGFGFTSALPFYFGLMAIAGAQLISNSYKK